MSYLLSLLLLFLCLIYASTYVYADSKPLINEFLPHPGTGEKEWVEFYIPDDTDIAGYWIDDDKSFDSDDGNSHIKKITSAVQGSDTHHAVFELSSSMFNNNGDTIALFDQNGTLVDHYVYTKDPRVDVSIGRVPDETGDFQALAYATRGSPNSPPKPTITPPPTPIIKPTKIPKPTVTPKPVKTSQVTQVTSAAGDNSVLADATYYTEQETSLTPSKTGSNSASPTSILRISIKPKIKKSAIVPTQQVMVEGTTSSLQEYIAISIGGILFMACGILIYFKKLKIKS
jgi:Lamin Tail Domain